MHGSEGGEGDNYGSISYGGFLILNLNINPENEDKREIGYIAIRKEIPSGMYKIALILANNQILTINLNLKQPSTSSEPTSYTNADNVIECELKTARYGYYSGYKLNRLHLGDFDDDVQAFFMSREYNPFLNLNHHFYKIQNNKHGYTKMSMWIDKKLIINKANINGLKAEWSQVHATTSELAAFFKLCDNQMHRVWIRYFKS